MVSKDEYNAVYSSSGYKRPTVSMVPCWSGLHSTSAYLWSSHCHQQFRAKFLNGQMNRFRHVVRLYWRNGARYGCSSWPHRGFGRSFTRRKRQWVSAPRTCPQFLSLATLACTPTPLSRRIFISAESCFAVLRQRLSVRSCLPQQVLLVHHGRVVSKVHYYSVLAGVSGFWSAIPGVRHSGGPPFRRSAIPEYYCYNNPITLTLS